MQGKKPLVSVAVITYNHEKYIAQALDSVLMQNTDFDYEIVVGDDASIDSTAEILKSYQDTHPEIINIIHHGSNVGIMTNDESVMRACRGKYVTFIEGDDVWTSDTKLAKQVALLEAHPEYVATAHKVLILGESDKLRKSGRVESNYRNNGVYTMKDFSKYKMAGHTTTLLCRRFDELLGEAKMQEYYECSAMIDRKRNLALAGLGQTYCTDEYMSAWRLHGAQWSQTAYVDEGIRYLFDETKKLENLSQKLFCTIPNFMEYRTKLLVRAALDYMKKRDSASKELVSDIYHADSNNILRVWYLLKNIVLLPFRKFRTLN